MSEILSEKEIGQFVLNGFVRIENAFSKEIANAVLDILWNDLPCNLLFQKKDVNFTIHFSGTTR